MDGQEAVKLAGTPYEIVRAGASRTNHSQRLPYPSKDMVQLRVVAKAFRDSLLDVFKFIGEMVSNSNE